jgi:hypothetical protein
MPYPRRPLYLPYVQLPIRQWHPIDPRSALQEGAPPSVDPRMMANPKDWGDENTYIMPEEDNPSRYRGVQAIAQMLGLGDRLQGRGR